MKPLDLDFYRRADVVQVAKDLLGKFLYSRVNDILVGGEIIETEAYAGEFDKACHAYKRRRTKRTEPMYREGGIAYVYLCYGMHHLLNVVTNQADIPHAVLIRAIRPQIGIEHMLKRRNKVAPDKHLTNGPATVCQALGIDLQMNFFSFLGEQLWIEEGPMPNKIISGPRIGVDYAGEDALLPWRFLCA